MCIFLHGLVIFISKAISFYYHNVKSSHDDVLCSPAVCNTLAVNTTAFFLRSKTSFSQMSQKSI